jgi:hypothetical protein
MTDKEMSRAAAEFIKRWQGEGYEKGQGQLFWGDLLTKVFGVEDLTSFVRYEDQVKSDTSTTNFIDVRIPSTKVFIEQKSINKDLRAPIKQSDGNFLTPYQQVKRYASDVKYSERPRWIITCNFKEFLVYDMEQPNGEPESILLKDLEKEYYRLKFLVDAKSEHISKEMEVSMQAGEIVGRIYDALLKQYDDNSPEALRWLNILCVRIVFCLYAEDAGIFSRDQFHDYLSRYDTEDMRNALIRLFEVLNTPIEKRSRYLKDDLKAFPYTNGGLFATEIEIPQFTDELRLVLLHNASLDFDWSAISPTIFGAVFESTLNPETRRAGGMHYTSIENIHKVIDALFLNTLRKEFETILEEKVEKTRNRLLDVFQDKLASLVFFDPACGSGNFLTETYLSLRRLENDVIRARYHGQTFLALEGNSPIKVSISQFYGIEINDFAVTVATTALWISESQMLAETEKIITFDDNFLPLKTYSNITEGNALRVDWESVVPKDKLSYIIGNPPFVGVNYMSDGQREDMDNIWSETKRGKLDYVTCWYMKAAVMMIGTNIRTALVSTNSVTQGEQAAIMWKALFDKGIHIDFAHRTFIWDSEASLKAHVHCVIVGFSWAPFKEKKYIYTSGNGTEATTINGYLLDAPVVIIEERSKPLCDVPSIVRGSQATDDGHYLFTPEEKAEFLKKEPQAERFFKRFMMGREFINNIERWCLWMPNITPTELKSCPEILKRVQAVKELREASKNKQTQQSANIPWRFGQYRVPAEHYIAFAKVSSERRRYVPFGFLTNEVIPGDKLFTIPDATIYMFGVLTSNVHMAWMRTVCGRLKSDYSYSTTIVYNNFPWPLPTEEQKAKIEQTAQGILDARALFPEASLADLYDEVAMPPELRKAHQMNDRAVMEAYGWKVSREFTESVCVAELFKLYQEKNK